MVDLLEARGITLGCPYSSDSRGSRSPLGGLEVQAEGRPLRVLYAFDPKQRAVFLLDADNTGMSDDRFYRTSVPCAEALGEEYLQAMG